MRSACSSLEQPPSWAVKALRADAGELLGPTCWYCLWELDSNFFMALANLSRDGSVSRDPQSALFIIRGSIMSPKIRIVSETLHLKHKTLLPLTLLLGFEHNYCVPLQSYSVQVKSSNNFLNGSIVPSIIVKIISLRSLLVLLVQPVQRLDRNCLNKFYLHFFLLSFIPITDSLLPYPKSVLTWRLQNKCQSSHWPESHLAMCLLHVQADFLCPDNG